MLLHKRNAFRFEEEIRLLWIDGGTEASEQWLPIAANEVISQILISPHVAEEQQNLIKDELTRYGVDVLSSGALHAPR